MDSDEEETFICLGNPVEQIDEDAPLKKPVFVGDLKVKDNKGRQRFHGAFTGGFSAGYFNSVGSKDGFAPSEFVSSRDKKYDSMRQKPEDFMDDEDFNEHGIAPRKLVTSEKFSTEERRKRRYDEGQALMTGTVFEGTSALTDYILPEKLSVGIKLLKKLGWKQGHGIGSRKKQEKESEQKVYGCSLPSQTEEGESDEEADFGPKDTTPISFVAKDNVHGLGYSGLDPRSALPGSHVNLFEPPAITKTGRKGIRGQGFGVGALEDEDDDIYTKDHMSNYDMTMEIEDTSNLHGWTAPKHKHESRQLAIGYIGKVLEGFMLTDKPLHQRKSFPPPELPRHFKPIHVFLKPKDTESDSIMKQKEQTSITRSIALGEVRSVFDLVSSKDKDKMERARMGTELSVVQSSDKNLISIPEGQQSFKAPSVISSTELQLVPVHTDITDESQQAQPGIDQPRTSAPAFQGGSLSFKPFIKDERKQARYEKYLVFVKQGMKDAYAEVTEGHMTEWEREREKEEFIKAGKMYKPLAGMIASRFTRAKFDDAVETVDVPAEEGGDKDDTEKAAEMKMYGRLTRNEYKWYPHKLLCRKFNVPEPYPGAGIVGLPTVKRDKFSVFNFLTFQPDEMAEPEDSGSRDDIQTSSASINDKKESASSEDKTSKSEDTLISSKPVSIFSHLSAPEKTKQQSHSGIKNEKTSEKPKSIFSHLVEETRDKSERLQKDANLDKADQGSDEKQAVAAEGETVDGKPSLDLFAAIFGNTDSEDSEDEELEDKQQDETPKTSVIPKQDMEIKPKDSSDVPEYLPGGPVVMETLEARLSPKVPEEPLSYGPLPPSSAAASTSIPVSTSFVSSADYLAPTCQRKHGTGDFVDPSLLPDRSKNTRDSSEHRKHKRSKSKHKKEKKSKSKKSKHKKKDKRKKKSYSDSDDSEESSSEENLPTDKELLHKMRTLPKGKHSLMR
ncbi:G patch domain-containing protein 1-like isoform X2 [Mytilus trossulus]|uniref:G patch domain-containing protein 1-like isoform X2 n=1 Tax=Mytilus trossulus TaxID=6551 RepID=UPI003006280E